MNNHLLFKFDVDKSSNTVYVHKAFDADLPLVWEAFTEAELLDQWWAPKPLMSRTKYMDFKVGGRRFYAMVSPEGVELGWQLFEYTSITPMSNFKCLSFFADKDENPQLPGASWNLDFREENALPGQHITRVSISIYFESLKELETMIQMGFKEGFTVTLHELELLLQTLKNRI